MPHCLEKVEIVPLVTVENFLATIQTGLEVLYSARMC